MMSRAKYVRLSEAVTTAELIRNGSHPSTHWSCWLNPILLTVGALHELVHKDVYKNIKSFFLGDEGKWRVGGYATQSQVTGCEVRCASLYARILGSGPLLLSLSLSLSLSLCCCYTG